MDTNELSEREKRILRSIINEFVLTANPVASRFIAKHYEMGLSPATIRNIMADLEEAGFLKHPHTSAGRIPTDKGYRLFVDSLMDPPALRSDQKESISRELAAFTEETDELLKITAMMLSDVTNQLACVTYPKLDTGILEKIQLVQLTSSRILVVVSITSGLVKTITLELNSGIRDNHIQIIQTLLNERLSGLTFSEIKRTFGERFKDVSETYRPIIRVFMDSADRIFTGIKKNEKAVVTGAKNILKQPEFEDPGHFQSIIELIEDKDVIVHFMNDDDKVNNAPAVPQNDLVIRIGSENKSEIFNDYSVIAKDYKVGEVSGTIGIVGPSRMDYSRIIANVVYIAEILSQYMKRTD